MTHTPFGTHPDPRSGLGEYSGENYDHRDETIRQLNAEIAALRATPTPDAHSEVVGQPIHALPMPKYDFQENRKDAHSEVGVNRLAIAKAFHDGPLGADDHEFRADSEQGKWCLDVVDFFNGAVEPLYSCLSAGVVNVLPGVAEPKYEAIQSSESPVEQLAYDLAVELEQADLDRNDFVTVNRAKLTAIAARVLERHTLTAGAVKEANQTLLGLLQIVDEIEIGPEPDEAIAQLRLALEAVFSSGGAAGAVKAEPVAMWPDAPEGWIASAPDVSEERWRKNSRNTFDAMCAMRNFINEHIPMPSLESDLLQGPENSIFCASVAEAVVSRIKRDEELLQRALERLNDIYDPQDDSLYELRAALTAALASKPEGER